MAVSCVKGAKRVQKGRKKGVKRCLGQRQVEAWGRFGGGSMNLEFDFELNVPHATHKALGLGRRISLDVKIMPRDYHREIQLEKPP